MKERGDLSLEVRRAAARAVEPASTRALSSPQLAAWLEQHLGAPESPENVFSFARAVELDERDEYPARAVDLVMQAKLNYLIPSESGGGQQSHEHLLQMMRVVSRRDLTVAIAQGQTYLAALTVWISGTDAQKALLSEVIKSGEQAALALTEEHHGSDILANEVIAERVAGGYVLSGSKWLINNGTRARVAVVQARTAADPGPRAYTLFLVDKAKVAPPGLVPVPRKRTLGIRGADISGIGFDRCFVAESAVIGTLGRGLDLTLKTMQVSRTMCAGFSLGAADTAIRAALDFAVTRRLYGQMMLDMPQVQRTLVDNFARLLICEHVSIASARVMHVSPRQMSLVSAVTKYFVPVTVEAIVRDMAVLLGARAYLREHHISGIFQKLARDQLVVSLFDGSTVVNLHAISRQLKGVLLRGPIAEAERSLRSERLQQIFTLADAVPPFCGRALEALGRGLDDVVGGIADLEPVLEAVLARSERSCGRQVAAYARQLLRDFDALASEYRTFLKTTSPKSAAKSPAVYEFARRYCTLFAASACVYTWCYNHSQLGTFFASGGWLVLCLNELLGPLSQGNDSALLEACRRSSLEGLLRLHQNHELFSSRPFPLARAGESTSTTATS